MGCGRAGEVLWLHESLPSFKGGFNSRRPLAVPRGVAQSGSAPGWGPGGRRFKSCLPDSFKFRESQRIWAKIPVNAGLCASGFRPYAQLFDGLVTAN
jgi:hypothetical protein